MVEESARSGDDNFRGWPLQFVDLNPYALAAVDWDCSNWEVACEAFEFSGYLDREFARWDQDESLEPASVVVNPLKYREGVGEGLSRPSVCLPDYVSSLKNRCDSFGLNWEHFFEAHVLDSLKKPGLET